MPAGDAIDSGTGVMPESPRLRALVHAGAGPEAVAAFWAEAVAQGKPLIELDDAHPEHGLVTFLYREGERPVTSVSLWEPVSWKAPADRQLRKLAGTDIWFLSWWVRRDLRCSYHVVVTYADADAPEAEGDPHNRHTALSDWTPKREEPTLVMPDAPAYPWLEEGPDTPRGTTHALTFRSEILGNERPVWAHVPAGWSPEGGPYPFVVIFDGEEWHSAPGILDRLVAAGEIPPIVAILVNQIGIRNAELTCNPDFSRAIATELVPWLRPQFALSDDPAQAALNGRSFGGLCSGWTALRHPDVFGNAFMQSGSCWMHPTVLPGYADPDWTLEQPVGEDAKVPTIIEAFMQADPAPIRIFQECGNVENGPPPARIWQTFGNRWLRDILALKGYDTVYREVVGGHDDAWWRGTFADGIRWIFAPDGNRT
ncbi:MAG TPA: alpha/beta hydrolase-fold protein [Thermomicrobiales bacterium]|nr:alpha/beta hydrolase-fold protein [Thermomicrobiales bacterium]